MRAEHTAEHIRSLVTKLTGASATGTVYYVTHDERQPVYVVYNALDTLWCRHYEPDLWAISIWNLKNDLEGIWFEVKDKEEDEMWQDIARQVLGMPDLTLQVVSELRVDNTAVSHRFTSSAGRIQLSRRKPTAEDLASGKIDRAHVVDGDYLYQWSLAEHGQTFASIVRGGPTP